MHHVCFTTTRTTYESELVEVASTLEAVVHQTHVHRSGDSHVVVRHLKEIG